MTLHEGLAVEVRGELALEHVVEDGGGALELVAENKEEGLDDEVADCIRSGIRVNGRGRTIVALVLPRFRFPSFCPVV